MSNRPGMLINLPPPPSDPMTPSEHGPGTPNSTTTSLSALSVVAIKDGAVGHNHNHGHHNRQTPSGATLEAERADRISRLAGLERVATVRQTPSGNIVPTQGGFAGMPHGYGKEISTVGTASATGSVGGKTTWASEMDYDANTDKMSESMDQDNDGASSTGAFSDEDKASLVGFGEGAGSTVSGPVSTANARMIAARNSMQNNLNAPPRTQSFQTQTQSGGSTPMSGVERYGAAMGSTNPKMMDGISFDQGITDTTVGTPPLADAQMGGRFSGMGAEMAENVMRDRLDDGDQRGMVTPPNNQNLGRFGFEGD